MVISHLPKEGRFATVQLSGQGREKPKQWYGVLDSTGDCEIRINMFSRAERHISVLRAPTRKTSCPLLPFVTQEHCCLSHRPTQPRLAMKVQTRYIKFLRHTTCQIVASVRS